MARYSWKLKWAIFLLRQLRDGDSPVGGLFGRDSINEEKVMMEGSLDTTGLVLGFEIDTEAETIAAPLPKVEGARIYILSDEFVVGSRHMSLKAMQTLRGYMQHWLTASMFWASCIQPVDLFLTYGSEDCQTLNCSNYQIWTGFWEMLTLLHALAKDDNVWPSLCKNSLSRALALHRRFAGPRVIEEVRWITSDATPDVIGAVDWRNSTYIRVDAEETTKDYVGTDGLQAGSADKELTGLVIGRVCGFSAQPGTVLFVGVGNLNAPAWVIKGKARGKFARRLLRTFLPWCVHR